MNVKKNNAIMVIRSLEHKHPKIIKSYDFGEKKWRIRFNYSVLNVIQDPIALENIGTKLLKINDFAKECNAVLISH